MGYDRVKCFTESVLADAAGWAGGTTPIPTANVLREQHLLKSSIWAFNETDAAPDRKAAFERHCNLSTARWTYIQLFGFSVPCAEAMFILHDLQPILEVGAGTGLWSACMRASNIDVVATDIEPQGKPGTYGFEPGSLTTVERLAAQVAVTRYPGRTVFCSWPCMRRNWLAETVRRMRAGQHLVLVGEPPGGCTGTDDLFEILDAHFEDVARLTIPQFPGLHDRLTVHRKRALAGPKGRLP